MTVGQLREAMKGMPDEWEIKFEIRLPEVKADRKEDPETDETGRDRKPWEHESGWWL